MPEETPKPEANNPEKEDASRQQRRQVARWTQEFLRWMPLGGSGGVFASFLLQQQWAQAVIMLPVTAIAGVWAAYSKNFVEQLQDIYADRAKQDAKNLVSWMDSLNEALKWQFSGFDAKYLKVQSSACVDYYGDDFKQQQGFMSPTLSQVYVPLMLDPSSLSLHQRSPSNRKLEEAQTEGCQIWDFLAQVRQVPAYQFIAIVADGGFGKTTLLRHITYTYAQGRYRRYRAPKFRPVLLYLRKWRDKIAEEKLSLPELIRLHIHDLSKAKPLPVPPLWAESLLERGEALILLDGFDEVADAQRPAVARWINTQVTTYGKARFLLSSRQGGFEAYQKLVDEAPDTSTKMPTTLTVREFTRQQRADFLKPWYLCQQQHTTQRKTSDVAQTAAQRASDLLAQIEQQPDLQRLAGNPLMLNLIAWVHWYAPGDQLPRERGKLYQTICDLQLGARPTAKRVVMLLDSAQERQQVLQGLALTMVQQEAVQLEKAETLKALKPHLEAVDDAASPAQFLKDATNISELLYEPDPKEYAFSHLSFRNYFAALEMQRLEHQQTGQEGQLFDQWRNDKWRETILLYSALLKPKPLEAFVRQGCQLGEDAVALAYRCFQLYPHPEKLPTGAEAFAAELRPLRYQQLETYLQNQQWRDADVETYRMMIQTINKEFGWFSAEDLQTFPCLDLLILDDLWLKYSKDESGTSKFGFSVQKQIWIECGSPTEYDDNWKKFGDRVGWRKDNLWLKFPDLTFNLKKSPKGEFPVWGDDVGVGSGGVVFSLSSIAQRLVECKR
ncbi:GUN4 domain-containing protein [Stenomitos frigidus]|uniref:NTPase (NACHT family) n=1 Tax=Stenomitos frigidus ULC18 TaxID=2107698 RepID=A0A2T1EPM9_9CYAN|nr:GUN4 domain-containing protein [Stenomitos frigidus]PSB34696.1 NTPase (NACHT family) [Stenomitos frigidus ULC18]